MEPSETFHSASPAGDDRRAGKPLVARDGLKWRTWQHGSSGFDVDLFRTQAGSSHEERSYTRAARTARSPGVRCWSKRVGVSTITHDRNKVTAFCCKAKSFND